MTGIWLLSYLVLWVMTLVLACVTLSLARLVGQLHRRLGPAGALVTDHGPEIGKNLGELLEREGIVADTPLQFPKSRDTLLIFVSPNCRSCEELLRDLRHFAPQNKQRLDVVLLSTSPELEQNGRFGEKVTSLALAYLIAPQVAQAAKIGPTPFATWLDKDGTVRAKGVVNHLEHLQSLVHARDSGFASLDDYFETREAPDTVSSSTT